MYKCTHAFYQQRLACCQPEKNRTASGVNASLMGGRSAEREGVGCGVETGEGVPLPTGEGAIFLVL